MNTQISKNRITEFEKIKEEWDQHIIDKTEEYGVYMKKKQASLSGDTPQTLNLSIDAMALLHLPFFNVVQPKMAYFKRRMSVTPMGIIDEAKKTGVTYFYTSRQGKTSANHVISVLQKYLGTVDKTLYNELNITFDNCKVNKNFILPGHFFTLVEEAIFNLVEWGFPMAGHTKFGPDGMFGWLGPYIKSYDLYEVADILEHANEAGTPSRWKAEEMKRNELMNHKSKLIDIVRPIAGINLFQRFRIRKDESGEIIMEGKHRSRNVNWEKINIFKKQTITSRKPPILKTLKFSEKKVKDLKALEQFVPEASYPMHTYNH